MDIIGLISAYGGWSWIVGGLVLLAIELVAPGGVFVWLGAAAVATGIASLIQPLDTAWQWGLFGLLSLVLIASWLGFMRRRRDMVTSDKPLLNQRAAQIVGQTTELNEAIKGGFGRVSIGDSTWRVKGPDLPAGQKVKVVGFEGAVLTVVAAD
jgi:hypothetical protein